MLKNSFCHIPSIGASTEIKIWNNGIKSQDDFLNKKIDFLPEKKKNLIIENIDISNKELKSGNPCYFTDNLPSKEHWRIFREFRNSAVYLDIETTGLGNYDDIITTIAIYDGKNVKYYVNGDNLDEFIEDINNYKLLITYNGKTFDIPFIEKYFGIKLNHAHIDLRYVLKALGFSGGLKSCERQLGIGRTGDVADVDGYFAVVLWNDYVETGSKKSLETLLSYNIEDVINLEFLMVYSYNKNLEKLPIVSDFIGIPLKKENPFEVDAKTIKRLKSFACNNGFGW